MFSTSPDVLRSVIYEQEAQLDELDQLDQLDQLDLCFCCTGR